MIYLAYATTGKEFEVEEALKERGFDVWCGRKVSFLRRGKKRRAEAVVTPKLPNYLFLTLTPYEWHALHSQPVKHLARTMYVLRSHVDTKKGATDDVRQLEKFKKQVDTDHAEGLKVADRNNVAEMAQFKKGQALTDLRGRFADNALTFRRMVEASGDFPLIEAETEMMGRVVTVRLDPLDVSG